LSGTGTPEKKKKKKKKKKGKNATTDLTADDDTAEVVIVEEVDKGFKRVASQSPGKMDALPSSKKRAGAGCWKRDRFYRLSVLQSLIQNNPFNAVH
jgi:hypothetical protein